LAHLPALAPLRLRPAQDASHASLDDGRESIDERAHRRPVAREGAFDELRIGREAHGVGCTKFPDVPGLSYWENPGGGIRIDSAKSDKRSTRRAPNHDPVEISISTGCSAVRYGGVAAQAWSMNATSSPLTLCEAIPKLCSPESGRLSPCVRPPYGVRDLRLEFLVSRDEEHVRLIAIRGRLAFDLGARSHHYLLLTLARRQIADIAQGIDEMSAGWLHLDEFGHDPAMASARLNLDVFRIRQQLRPLGLADATDIVERRPRARQIRIGVGRNSIRRV
jgi:hypothetical protein